MERFIEVDGIRTRYFEEGKGPALVLLHGISLGSSADVWEGDLDVFARAGFRVLAYDQPGFGLTETTDLTEAFQYEFALKFMDALGIARASLIGHSYSGQIVVRLAIERESRVSRIVVVATGSLLPPLPGEEPLRERDRPDAPPTRESVRRLLESQLFNHSVITPNVLERRYRMSVGKNFEAFLERRSIRARETEIIPLGRRLKEVPVPLIMLYGTHDRKGTAERCALLREKEPALRTELIQNAGHLLMWDVRGIFHQKVVDFLSP